MKVSSLTARAVPHRTQDLVFAAYPTIRYHCGSIQARKALVIFANVCTRRSGGHGRLSPAARRSAPRVWAPIALALTVSAPPGTAATDVMLDASPPRARDGSFTLSWGADADAAKAFRVTERTGAQPVTLYEGADTARFQSGKPDGRYVYRVAALSAGGEVLGTSDEIEVVVDHHSLMRALSFFALGAFVFGAIIVRIALGPSDR